MPQANKVKKKRSCFVLMPISEPEQYPKGHFARVYKHLIQPACRLAGLEPMRADDVLATNYIILDVIQKIVESDLVLCDLSSRNPNVLYELGIRQAFNLPAVLMSDSRTDRIFDIQGLRTLEYDDTLRIDSVEQDSKKLADSLEETLKNGGKGVNSLVSLLGVRPAELVEPEAVSAETSLVLEALKDLGRRITRIEDRAKRSRVASMRTLVRDEGGAYLPNGESVSAGDRVYDGESSEPLGEFINVRTYGVLLREGGRNILIPQESQIWEKLTTIPF